MTLWTVAHQAPLSMGFSRQEYWSGLPCPPPGIEPSSLASLTSPALAGRFLVASTTRKPTCMQSGFKGSRISIPGNSRVVQWSGPHTSTAVCPGSIPGRGTKIPQVHGVTRKKKNPRSKCYQVKMTSLQVLTTTKPKFGIITFSCGPRCRHSPQ